MTQHNKVVFPNVTCPNCDYDEFTIVAMKGGSYIRIKCRKCHKYWYYDPKEEVII